MRRRDREVSVDRSVGALLESMVGEPSIRQGMERARLLDAFSGISESVLGKRASANCHAVQVSDQTIVVEVSDSIWAQRVQLSSRGLLAALRDAGAPAGMVRIRTRPTTRRPEARAAAARSSGSPGGRCQRCGGTSTGASFCLACEAEADFWKMSSA
jgi:hypothetical protein